VTFVTGIADVTMSDGQIAALQQDFCIWRDDLRGRGGTQATPGGYSFQNLLGFNDTIDGNPERS
jgi:hypothetical protein